MTRLAKSTLTSAIVIILFVSMNSVGDAGCHNSRSKRKTSRQTIYRTPVKPIQEAASPSDEIQDSMPVKIVSRQRVINGTPSVTYTVIQELRPGTGLDSNDMDNPVINRGTFDSLKKAQDNAEMWRDVMPGWEVEVVKASTK